jgi:hypothetical protein
LVCSVRRSIIDPSMGLPFLYCKPHFTAGHGWKPEQTPSQKAGLMAKLQ